MADSELQELAAQIAQDGGYLKVRVLPDQTIVALGDLIYTRAIFMDCDSTGYGRRFCFADRTLADRRFDELQSADDVPEGAIAQR